jgi:hypothetical protein
MKLSKPFIYITFSLLLLSQFIKAQDDEEEIVDSDIIDDEHVEAEPSEEMLKEISSGIVDTSLYPGRIISRKKVVSKVPAAGQALEFEYTIWNVGNSDVMDVELVDSFNGEDFEEGKSVTIKKDVIKPGDFYKETHSVIPKMNEAAQIKLSPATVTYKTKTSNDNEELIQYSSDGATEGIVPIKTAAFYARHVASHYTDWLIFLALAFPSTYLPYTQASSLIEKYTKAKTA